jgi:hypothetical protein
VVVTAQDQVRDPAAIVADLERRGVVLRVLGDSIDCDAPHGVLTIADLGRLLKHKSELLAHLSASEPDEFPDEPTRLNLDSMRWSPSVSSDDPPIDIPADRWDWEVANWPHAKWVAWHRRVTELTPWGSTAEEIKEAGHRAYLEISDRIARARCIDP